MPASRPPWWLYFAAVSFLGFFALQIHSFLWGPEHLDIIPDYRNGSITVRHVFPNGTAARAGLRSGDRIVAVDGIPIFPGERSLSVWVSASTNFETGRPIPLTVERGTHQIEAMLNLLPTSPRNLPWTLWQFFSGGALTLILALVIAFRRPHDSIARVGAWLLASVAIMLVLGYGSASVWRHLPVALGLLLWPAFISRGLSLGIGLTFVSIFPRKLFRGRWIWILIWLPAGLTAVLQCLLYLQLVYRPGAASAWLLNSSDYATYLPGLIYLPAIVLVCIFQYRRLDNLNEKRRMRVLFAGLLVSGLAIFVLTALTWIAPGSTSYAAASSPLTALLFTLYLAGPVAFAYAILRHRIFDLGLILRLGLQYALARRALVSAVPILAAIFIADLLLHGDQPMLTVIRARGWIYAVLAALAAVAYWKRQSWLNALDRRFFREQYDARRLLCEVVEEIHVARSFEQEAPRVISRIESALHPAFAAIVVSEPQEKFCRTLAASPAGTGPPPLQRDSKLLSLIRILGKPLEVQQSNTSWLQQQLPHEETDYLRRGRIDLLVPVVTDPERTEVLLVLGAKRSEEPYSSEDRDLLVAIAASLAILLERPVTAAALPRKDLFEECPQCGSCYDSGVSQCTKEGARLLPVILPRLLEGRYLLQQRLGRGGMGTVYAASDASLERRVAVKVIREDLVGSAEAAERFRREARAAASFAHPNVVTVYDFGVASGTRAFLVMEILEGATLRERLKAEKRLSTQKLLCVVRDICSALGAAHSRHLVHRDLKPENIFMVSSGAGEVAKILDFGLAKFVASPTEDRTCDTATGAILGTVRYMSPEQREGQSADQAWDIWALAVTTYEMLTGCYPFDDGNRDRFAVAPVFPFTPIATHVPGEVGAWQSLFEHSFAREMSVRLNSAEAFLSALQLAASKPVI